MITHKEALSILTPVIPQHKPGYLVSLARRIITATEREAPVYAPA
jgi:hypothetical protein